MIQQTDTIVRVSSGPVSKLVAECLYCSHRSFTMLPLMCSGILGAWASLDVSVWFNNAMADHEELSMQLSFGKSRKAGPGDALAIGRKAI